MLRRWKLDEIPKLLNVISGDMSLVGPRPTLEWDAARYDESEKILLSVKPGITDWASITFRHEGEILAKESDPDEAYDRIIRPEKLRLGLEYVRRASMAEDLRILMATARAVASRSREPNLPLEGTRQLAATSRRLLSSGPLQRMLSNSGLPDRGIVSSRPRCGWRVGRGRVRIGIWAFEGGFPYEAGYRNRR